MTKKEFRRILKEMMQERGYQTRGSEYYRVVDDMEFVVEVDHNPYGKKYAIYFHVIYLSADKETADEAWPDFGQFYFKQYTDEELNRFSAEKAAQESGEMTMWFPYEERSEEELRNSIAINYDKQIKPLYDREVILNKYRKDWGQFRLKCFGQTRREKVKVICKLAGMEEYYNLIVKYTEAKIIEEEGEELAKKYPPDLKKAEEYRIERKKKLEEKWARLEKEKREEEERKKAEREKLRKERAEQRKAEKELAKKKQTEGAEKQSERKI